MLAIVIFQMAVISALRLKFVLAAFGAPMKFMRVAGTTWCGFFVEQAGAVFIAGDFARMLLLRQMQPTVAIEAPPLDRAVGLLMIGFMAAVGMAYIWQR